MLTLAAIARKTEAKELPRKLTIFISAGLPLLQLNRDGEKFKRYLLKNDEKPIYFIFENKEYEIQIEDVRLQG